MNTASAVTTNPVPTPFVAGEDPNAKLRALGLHTADSLDALCAADTGQTWILDGLISKGTVNIAVGDSGLGKSALLFQLGLCVAAGISWLGVPTTAGRVIFVDLENGERDSREMQNDLLRHLGLAKCPDNFLTHYGEKLYADPQYLGQLVREVKPKLVIVDSLRAFKPDAEENNVNAGNFMNRFRAVGKQYDTAFLFVHHIRKPDEKNGVPGLESVPAMQWLNQACGARALTNQTDFRLGIDLPRSNFLSNPRVAEETALILRGHRRVIGEFGPLHVARCYGDDGEAIGYRRISGADLLTEDQRLFLDRLPEHFNLKTAKLTYGRGDQATLDLLRKYERAGLLIHPARGRYERVTGSR